MLKTAETLLIQIRQTAETYATPTGCCSSLFSNSQLTNGMNQIIALVDAVLDEVDDSKNSPEAGLSTSAAYLDESAITNLKAIQNILRSDFFRSINNERIRERFDQIDLQISVQLLYLMQQKISESLGYAQGKSNNHNNTGALAC